MGTQDSAEVVTEVGVSFWKGKLTSMLLFAHCNLSVIIANNFVFTSRLCTWRSHMLHTASWLWSRDIEPSGSFCGARGDSLLADR
jgi:hypothetical protein